MGMNETPGAERVHISFFGRRNAGKSSVLNAVTGQDLAVVSEIYGTTTDPVHKAMELLPLGPVVVTDTPGIDDEGELGALRVKKSWQVLNRTDVAVLVVDGARGLSEEDLELAERIKKKGLPLIVVYNKADLLSERNISPLGQMQPLLVSARTGEGITALKEELARLGRGQENGRRIVADLLNPSDFTVLVVPIDSAAPKGRLILPQQQTIRDVLEVGATAIVVRDTELRETLENVGKRPKLVITDSQAFGQVAKDTPRDILLTSFSILFARYKGNLASVVAGAKALDRIKDGDAILISEGCTHHRQCDDIGSVKIPRWIREFTGVEPKFVFTSGTEFPEDLSPYRLIVHCGGCMLNEKEMKYRLRCAADQGIPMTNYGILIAYMKGILARSVEAFPEIARTLTQ